MNAMTTNNMTYMIDAATAPMTVVAADRKDVNPINDIKLSGVLVGDNVT